jgi:hypothetical protein
MANSDLIKFIKEARKRGFDDYQIRAPLIKEGWPNEEIESAFKEIKDKREKEYSGAKIQIRVNLDKKVYDILDKRAKKNLLSAEEQAEDIIRRSSALSLKRTPQTEKIDDLLVGIFSRKKRK